MNRKGITLIELVIYVALLTIVTLLIGKVFRSMVSNYSSNKKNIRLQADSRDICAVMAREIRNTGLKAYLKQTDDTYSEIIVPGTWFYENGDNASFIHGNGTPGDTLRIRKINLDKNGALDGDVDDISYYLDGTTLIREADGERLPVAKNVYALQFQYGISAACDTVIDQNPPKYNNWKIHTSSGSSPVITGTTDNMLLTFNSAATGWIQYDPTQFSIPNDQKLSIYISIIPQDGYPTGIDSLKISIITSAGKPLGEERFMPYNSATPVRILVPVEAASAARIAIDYGVSASGSLLIEGVTVVRSATGSITWVDDPENEEKPFVRAIKMHVMTRSEQNVGGSAASTIQIADAVIERPARYTWRLFTEAVEMVNNGVF